MTEQTKSIILIFWKLLTRDSDFWALVGCSIFSFMGLRLFLKRKAAERANAPVRIVPFPPALPEEYPVRTELTVLPADEPKTQTIGLQVTERRGVGIRSESTSTPKAKAVKKKAALVKRSPKKKAGPRSRFDRLDEDD